MTRRNQTRTYTIHKWKGKVSLVSWVQARCTVCQRFLSKGRHKYCLECYQKKLIQKRKEWGQKVNYHSRQCKLCHKSLGVHDEYICSNCFNEKMKEDMELLAKEQQQEEEYERDEQYSQDWRFRDSRGRSVFRRDM